MNPIDNYAYLPHGLAEAFKNFRGVLEGAYSKVDSDPAGAKQDINNVYTGLQAIANGLNLQGRNALLGQTPVSTTSPVAPELESETVPTLS